MCSITCQIDYRYYIFRNNPEPTSIVNRECMGSICAVCSSSCLWREHFTEIILLQDSAKPMQKDVLQNIALIEKMCILKLNWDKNWSVIEMKSCIERNCVIELFPYFHLLWSLLSNNIFHIIKNDVDFNILKTFLWKANKFWQQSIENWLKIRSLGRRLHPNYSNFLENIISSSMYDTISSGVMIWVLWSIDFICSSPL